MQTTQELIAELESANVEFEKSVKDLQTANKVYLSQIQDIKFMVRRMKMNMLMAGVIPKEENDTETITQC